MFDIVKLGVAVVAGALVAYPLGYNEGLKFQRLVQIEQSLEHIRKRDADEKEIGSLSNGDRCTELGGIWLPDSQECE